MPTRINYAQLAAYIDGEGHISICRVNPKGRGKTIGHFLAVEVCNSDPRLVYWLKEMFGGNVYQHKKTWNPKWKLQYKWRINGSAAAAVLSKCLPYFVIKGEQVAIALRFSQTLLGTKLGMGRRLPPRVVEQREQLKAELMKLTHRGTENSPVYIH